MKVFAANQWKSVLPEGWTDRSMITLVGQTGASGIAPNIVVTRQEIDGYVSIEDFAESQKQLIFDEIGTLEILDERPANIGGAPAFQRLQKFQVDDLHFQQVQTFILGEGIIIAITGTAAIEEFNGIINAVREFTENFELTND